MDAVTKKIMVVRLTNDVNSSISERGAGGPMQSVVFKLDFYPSSISFSFN